MPKPSGQRQSWGTKIGIIMAVAGSAIGLGNFLRFPVQAANNGGGSFMIPYFISLIFMGIPLMWVEWTIGRYGGGFGHGTAPGAFHSMWAKNRFIKYFGIIGIFGPMVIFIYYTYIESWLLGFTVFSITGRALLPGSQEAMQSFLAGYQGIETNEYFTGRLWAYIFFLITFVLNMYVITHGISRGIERFTKWATPLLLISGILLAVRILTLTPVNPAHPDWTVTAGLGFLWNPDFSRLTDARVWLAAAGQIFFTLSVGIGAILTYTSYLKKNDDIVLSGLSSVSTNEFAEVVLGSSIIIPATFLFFGPVGTTEIAKSGAFNLGFVTMPMIFQQIPAGQFFGALWFSLLFLAGVTSSISLAQPAITFLEDEFNIPQAKATRIFAVVTFVLCHFPILFLGQGVLDEMDFWGGTFCLVVFATIESILFSWVFGIDRAWDEMHLGSEIRVPRFYKFILKYVTPLFLIAILVWWFIQQGAPVILMKNIPDELKPYALGTRAALVVLAVTLCLLVKLAWRRRKKSGDLPDYSLPDSR
ncbi:MAG: sodium-dependent transporter [Candidatus Omnitrophica bacterium]|nr:sodium-dependent transporter [Candidatus Omnitrophota bacterium]